MVFAIRLWMDNCRVSKDILRVIQVKIRLAEGAEDLIASEGVGGRPDSWSTAPVSRWLC